MNVVMTVAESSSRCKARPSRPVSRARLDALLGLAEGGIRRLVDLQRQARAARDQRTFSLAG